MVNLKCQKCDKEYSVFKSRVERSKYCSRVCHNSMAGIVGGKAGKGVTRNKGNIRKDLSERNKVIVYLGNRNASWKGEAVGYGALHAYIKKHFGKATQCEKCFSLKNIQWANKSHKYLRDRDDWIQLCASCHKKYDIETEHIIGKYKNHKLV